LGNMHACHFSCSVTIHLSCLLGPDMSPPAQTQHSTIQPVTVSWYAVLNLPEMIMLYHISAFKTRQSFLQIDWGPVDLLYPCRQLDGILQPPYTWLSVAPIECVASGYRESDQNDSAAIVVAEGQLDLFPRALTSHGRQRAQKYLTVLS
jgi:hypothetical protein